MKLIQKNIGGSSLFRNTLKMSATNVLMYFIPVIVTPILSRMYPQESFGEWGVFYSVISILGVAMFFGYENAIVKAESEQDSRHLGIICLVISLFTITLTFLVFKAGSALGIRFFQTFPQQWLLYIYLVLYALYMILYNFCNRQEMYNALAISHIVRGGSQALLRILFGLVILGTINGLIFGTTLAQALTVVFFAICLRKFLSDSGWTHISKKRIKELLYINRRFPMFDAPASVLAFTAFQSPTLILSQYFSKAEVGCFSIVIQLLLLPMSFIGAAMGKVYYQQLCQVRNDAAAIRQISKKVVDTVCIISILPLLFLAVGGDKLLVIFLGEKWVTAGAVALCLALWSFPTVLSQPMVPLYRTLDRQKNLLLFNALYFVGGVGSIVYGCLTAKPLCIILLIFSLVTAICKFCMFMNLLKLSGLKFRELNKYILCLWIISIIILAIRLKDIVLLNC
ncbi:MAG: oligosaccharide flippase family protein [Bacteroidales bacterium]|nr:oligosaccharide flippase family protein [Bacteroidales bacterium]MBO7494900.1 oligosaccharide flippase family protein [Bacteroidales bacterium]